MTWILDLTRQYEGDDSKVPIFGIVLYTNAHPNTRKVLRDQDYWDALDEISGPKWPIFSIRARQGTHEIKGSSDPNLVSMMVPVWREPQENNELLKLFQIKSTERLPAFVVFTQGEDDILDRIVIPLRDSSPDAAFDELRRVIDVIATAIEEIDERHLQSRDGVMSAVHLALQGYQDRKRIRNSYAILKEIRDWLPF